jgi:predicted PurR-regulated permease PerM
MILTRIWVIFVIIVLYFELKERILMRKKILDSIYSFLTNKENLYRGFFLILIFIVLTVNSSVSFAIMMSSIIASLSSNFVEKLEVKFKIPRLASAFIILATVSTSLIYLLKKVIILIIIQSSKILSVINDHAFIDKKIDQLENIANKISESLLPVKEKAQNMPYGLKKLDEFIDSLPDLLMHKLIEFLKPLIEKFYIPGLKLVNFGYTLILTLVFLFFFIYDWNKIKNFLKYSVGYEYDKKLNQIALFLKNTVITILFSQIKVAVILTFLYSSVLYWMKFEYFLIYAILFAFLILIPFIGYFISFTVLSFSCFIFGYSLHYSLQLLLILLCGMLIENLILTPKFVGSSIDAHPLVILLCLLLLPHFFGIFGVILVLPFAAILSKIISYMQKELDKSIKLKELEENGEL